MHKFSTRLIAAVVVAVMGVGVAYAQTPSFFSSAAKLDTTAYSLRMWGADRFGTAAAVAVASVGDETSNAYPFDQADKTDADEAWGLTTCPSAVGVAAGDVPADALAASALWEAGSFTAPLAVGSGSATVDATDGLLLLTESTRQNATDLNSSTIAALNKVKSLCEGGTGSTFDAVIFGGTGAVPLGAAETLDTIAVDVVRLGGVNRDDTARKVAFAVNEAQGGLNDVTYFPTAASTGTSLTDSVFLAENVTGADALAIGAYAAPNNVPVLTTFSTSLPAATKSALTVLSPANIIVIGGTGAISAAVATAAASAAGGATVTRIGGADRWETSVLISEQLFDYWPANSGAGAFSQQEFAFARSEGTGLAHVGWPDALVSSWFLATAENETSTPIRLAPPVEKNDGVTTIGGSDGGDIPMLLTQQSSLPSSVSTYLAGLYPDSTVIKTATVTGGANHGGFGFLFGGTGAIGSSVEQTIADKLSGGTYTSANRSDLTPASTAALIYYTGIDYTGYTTVNGGGVDDGIDTIASGEHVCAWRNGFTGTEYLAAYEATGATGFVDSVQLDYQSDAAGTGFTINQTRASCVDVTGTSPTTDDAVKAYGVSLSGHETATKTLDWKAAATRVSVTEGDAGTCTAAPTFTGATPGEQADATSTSVTYSWTGCALGAGGVTHKGTAYPGATYDAALTMTRTDSPGAGAGVDSLTLTGTLTFKNGTTTLFVAALTGESTTLASPFEFAGFYAIGSTLGGFHLEWTGDGAAADLGDVVINGNA
jgi:hypothetical protein